MKNVKAKILGAILTIATAMGAIAPQAAVFAEKNIDIKVSDYGYGEYLVKAVAIGYNDVTDEDYVTFYYLPVVGEATENSSIGGYDVDLQYSADDGTVDTGEVSKIIVNVYDSNGNLIEGLSPVEVLPPTTHIELPFEKYNLPTGTYTISISAYNIDGEELYKPYEIEVYYQAPALPVPNTGGIFQDLNISRTDYLITGLIIFGIVAVAGVTFIIRNDKKKVTGKRKK